MEPFPLSDQYKSSWKKRKAEAEATGAPPQPKSKKKVKPAASKSSSCRSQSTGAYTPQVFASTRLQYIAKLKEEGLGHREASLKWNESEEKRNLLKDLSVSELIRRRFVQKGCQANPFA